MEFKKQIILIVLFISPSLWAKNFDAYVYPKIDSSVKTCPKGQKEIAQELLDLELAGRRLALAKASCVEKMSLKYVQHLKDPADFILDYKETVKTKIQKIKFNKKKYTYEVSFLAYGLDGKAVRDSFSFMRNAEGGKAKPEIGCASLSTNPSQVYVSSSCL